MGSFKFRLSSASWVAFILVEKIQIKSLWKCKPCVTVPWHSGEADWWCSLVISFSLRLACVCFYSWWGFLRAASLSPPFSFPFLSAPPPSSLRVDRSDLPPLSSLPPSFLSTWSFSQAFSRLHVIPRLIPEIPALLLLQTSGSRKATRQQTASKVTSLKMKTDISLPALLADC